MKAKEANLLNFLQGPKQFNIPIYQRTYSWHIKQCERLFNDIMRVSTAAQTPVHFIGSVVYFEEGVHNMTVVPRYLVIDGQQRLTTITLLLAALAECIAANGDSEEQFGITARKIRNYYLFNSDESGELEFKLLLTRKDKTTLSNLLKGFPLGAGASVRVSENFEYFKSRVSPERARQLYEGLQKLLVVDVALERGTDNPQLIFESLNSTGLELSQADLIRNYVLMGQEQQLQTYLYERYWYPMEQSFGEAYAEDFDWFMRDYLTIKTGQIPRRYEVYQSFKDFTQGRNTAEHVEQIISDIHKYAGYYVRITQNKEPNKQLAEALNDLSVLKVDVVHPLLLEVYGDYEEGKLTTEEFTEVVRIIEAYVFRRFICGIPTNSMNKTFATFARSLDKTRYLESVKAQFLLRDSYRRFPTDSEFMREFVIRDIYNSSRSRVYLLGRLENQGRREKVKVDEFTIEHIMPQNPNLSEEWQAELGSDWKIIQEKYLHTIGNLTLTAYNPSLSDRPFAEKQIIEGGFRDSPIRLNASVAQENHWNESTIKRRAEELAIKACTIWKAPELNEAILEEYRNGGRYIQTPLADEEPEREEVQHVSILDMAE